MTTKELLYLEDALGHEKYFQTKCSETANQIQDADLKSCVQQMAQKHQQIFQSFYGFFQRKTQCESAFYPLNFWMCQSRTNLRFAQERNAYNYG